MNTKQINGMIKDVVFAGIDHMVPNSTIPFLFHTG